MSNSDAVFAKSSSASGSLRAFTSFTSTVRSAVAPASASPAPGPISSVTLRMSPGFVPASCSSSADPNSPDPTK